MDQLTAVSLFSGMGGLDLGARSAGVRVLLATDADETALDLLHAAQGTPVLAGDLRDLLQSGALVDALGGTRPDIVFGGPPCTGFSHAGFWLEKKRSGHDPAATLVDTFVDAVRVIRPRAFVLENVPGLRFKTYKSFYDSLVNRTRRAGYSVGSAILDASDYGVPQARRRLFVVGLLDGRQVDVSLAQKLPRRTASWAIGGIERDGPVEPDERPTGIHGGWIEQIPPGGNYLHLTKERGHAVAPFTYRGRYWSFLLKLDPDAPAWTIPARRVTYNGPFHWSGRHLRVREMARLQTFPDSQPLSTDLSAARRHIGNAVPPLLATSVFSYVARAMGYDAGVPALIAAARHEGATFETVSSSYPGYGT